MNALGAGHDFADCGLGRKDHDEIMARAARLRAIKAAIAARTGRHIDAIKAHEIDLGDDGPEVPSASGTSRAAVRKALDEIGWDAPLDSLAGHLGLSSRRQRHLLSTVASQLRRDATIPRSGVAINYATVRPILDRLGWGAGLDRVAEALGVSSPTDRLAASIVMGNLRRDRRRVSARGRRFA